MFVVEFREAWSEKLFALAEIMECGCVIVSNKRRLSEPDRIEVWPLPSLILVRTLFSLFMLHPHTCLLSLGHLLYYLANGEGR